MASKEYELAVKIAGQLDSSFNAAIMGAKAGLSGLGVSGKVGSLAMKGVGVAAKATAAAMAAAGAATLAVGAASLKVGKEFDTAISQLAATMGTTTDQIGDLEAKAKEMGATTKFTATEAAQGLNILAMAGLSAQDQIAGIGTVLNLASAGAMSMEDSASYITGTVKGFSDSMNNARYYADLMAKGATLANTDVTGLGEALSFVSSTAAGYSQSADSVTLSLLRLAEQNVTGQTAAFALNRAMADVYTPTTKAAAALQSLGVSAYDSAGKARDFNVVADEISAALSGMSDEQANALKSTIFTTRGLQAFNKMTVSSASTVDKFREGLAGASDGIGAAAQQAATQLDNLEGDLTLFSSAADGLLLSIYGAIKESSRGIVQLGTEYIGQLSAAFNSGGMKELFSEVGNIAADGFSRLAERAPEFIDMGANMVEAFIDGIDSNAGAIGNSAGKIGTSLASAFIRIMPKMIATGGKLLVAFGQGIIQNLPQLKDAAVEAVKYFMQAAKDAFKGFVNFLGDDQVAPFEKILALVPLLVGGFAVVDGIGGSIKGLVNSFKGVDKASKTMKKSVGGAGSAMSGLAKNILGIGVGVGAAAAGMWLLADAATKIADAGPGALITLVAMAGGIAALMLVASKLGPQLQSCQQGLIAFGAGVLMAAAGMAVMAFAATQLAQAGPLAFAALVLMVGGIAGLMAIAGAMGTQLATATPGLLAFGAAIILAGAGMAIMSSAAIQLAAAGGPAIAVFAGMAVAIAAFMAVAAALGPTLIAGGAGMLLLGAGLLVAAAGMALLANTAIQLSAAGAPAIAMMAALAVGILAFGAAAGALAPLLLAGAAALAAFGAALAIVSAAAVLGSAALLIISAALPALAQYGAAGAVAIVELGAAMTAFAAGAALAGAGAAAAGVGFGALALAAAAADLAFAPLALEMTAVAAAIKTISSSAKTAASGLKSMKKSTSGMMTSMAKLALAFAPVAAAIVPFSAAVAAGAAATAAFAAALTAADVALAAMLVAVTATAAGLTMIVAAMVMFQAQAATLGSAAGTASEAFTQLGAAAVPASAALITIVAPLTAAAAAIAAFAAGALSGVAALTVLAASLAAIAAASSAATTSLKTFSTATTQTGTAVKSLQATVQTAFNSIRNSIATQMNQAVAAVQNGVAAMKAAMNFSWSLPHLKVPHIKVSGSFSLEPPSAPNFSVSWYKQGGILSGAQIFGASGNTLLGGGEAGQEAVLPLDTLWTRMRSIMGDVVNGIDGSGMTAIIDRLDAMSAGRSETSVGDALGEFDNGPDDDDYPEPGNGPVYTITFNPTYQFYGEAPTQEAMVGAARMSQSEFNDMMDAWVKDHNRKDF